MTMLCPLLSIARRPGRAAAVLLSLLIAWSSLPAPVAAASRIKDIADFEGVRENLLVGYGLVVGLNGTGDTLNNSPFTRQSIISMLERLGVNTKNQTLRTANVAAVMVAGSLPPFARQGTRMDITVSTLGDSKSLLGGTLLVTPLMGADGEVYAVAQGNIVTGGFSVQGAAASVTKGVPTSGRIPNGAVVEREVAFELAELDRVRLSLRNPDFTTAQRVSQAINASLGGPVSRVLDPATVQIALPPVRADIPTLMTRIEQLRVEPDSIARVVIDEQSGVIVIGREVRVDTVAIAQGNLTVRVTESPQVSQPQAFSATGQTTVVPRTDIQIDEGEGRKLAVVEPGVTLQDLVNGLNALGVGPRDMISILQAIKAAGALQADLVVH